MREHLAILFPQPSSDSLLELLQYCYSGYGLLPIPVVFELIMNMVVMIVVMVMVVVVMVVIIMIVFIVKLPIPHKEFREQEPYRDACDKTYGELFVAREDPLNLNALFVSSR